MNKLLYCISCKEYTLKETCPRCSAKTLTPKPAKFSVEDHYGAYRRKAKEAAQDEASA